MDTDYLFIADLATEIETPKDGTLSRTLVNTDRLKAVLFAFSAGQELSEHTASMPAVLQFLSGQARVKLGDDWVDAQAGSMIHMPAGLIHAVRATTAVKMLLLLLKNSP